MSLHGLVTLILALSFTLIPTSAAFGQENDPVSASDASPMADSTPSSETVDTPITTDTSPPRSTVSMAAISVAQANIRSAPSIASSVVEEVSNGTRVEVIGQSADWFEVRLPDQREGWVAPGWVVATNEDPAPAIPVTGPPVQATLIGCEGRALSLQCQAVSLLPDASRKSGPGVEYSPYLVSQVPSPVGTAIFLNAFNTMTSDRSVSIALQWHRSSTTTGTPVPMANAPALPRTSGVRCLTSSSKTI